mgnify:FL=1
MKSLTVFVFIIFLFVSIYFAFLLKKREKIKINRESSWPEVLDLTISALQSGASISESLANLGRVGPNAIKKEFRRFEENILSGKKFDDCLTDLKREFADPISDQLFECLYFASKFGSKNTVKVLRELSEYVSADLAVRAEITTRFGWVRNSANLAALAPWILFLILRTQENAKAAYLEPTGKLIMLFGVLATITAYIWMNKIAKLPKSKRLFTMQMIEK